MKNLLKYPGSSLQNLRKKNVLKIIWRHLLKYPGSSLPYREDPACLRIAQFQLHKMSRQGDLPGCPKIGKNESTLIMDGPKVLSPHWSHMYYMHSYQSSFANRQTQTLGQMPTKIFWKIPLLDLHFLGFCTSLDNQTSNWTQMLCK